MLVLRVRELAFGSPQLYEGEQPMDANLDTFIALWKGIVLLLYRF
jgi:hypothetical protein